MSRTATCVWRVDAALVLALDERLGPPVDSYLNGSQTWLADVGPGELGLIVDSYGLLALVVDQASAAAELHLDAGDEVHLSAVGEARDVDAASSTPTPVTLGRRPGVGR